MPDTLPVTPLVRVEAVDVREYGRRSCGVQWDSRSTTWGRGENTGRRWDGEEESGLEGPT